MRGLGLQLAVALRGDFDEEVGKGRALTARSLTSAVFEYTDEIETDWRRDVERSGLANAGKLSKTIRSAKYPNEGLDAAGRVFSKFPIIQQAFEAETTVKSKDGSFLLVPNPDVWPEGRIRQPTRGTGRKNTLAIAERTFGPLRLVYRKDGPSWLVADARESATRQGLFRRASASAIASGKVRTIIVFFLLPQVRLPKLLSGREIRRRARAKAPERLQALFVKHFEADDLDRLPGPRSGA